MIATEVEEIAFRLGSILKSIEQIPFNSVQQELMWRVIYEEINYIQETLEEDEAFTTKITVN
tara:strand:- start:965 stop:1150 length:186 start_codon:yes stop_codon:yes gene_type:complete